MIKYNIEIKWTIRFILLVVAWAIGEKFIGLHDVYIENYAIYTNLFAIPAFLFYYLALREKKKNFYNDKMTFAQGFVFGIILSFFIALLMPVAQFVIYKSVTPHFFDNVIDYKLKNTSMTLETAKTFFNLKTYIIEGSFGALSKGMVTAAIFSLVLKTKK